MAIFQKSDLFPLIGFSALMFWVAFIDSGRVYRSLTLQKPNWNESKRKRISIVSSLIAYLPLPLLFHIGDSVSGVYGVCVWISIPLWWLIYYLWSVSGVKKEPA